MTKALVIGVGNPSRGDDGFGWRAAELLQTLLDPATTEVMTCRRLTPELSVSMSSADLVIFIRASIDDEPGSIELQLLRPAKESAGVHAPDCSPESLMTLAEKLYGNSLPAYRVTVGGDDFHSETGLSKAVSSVLPRVLDRIATLISIHVEQDSKKA